MNNDFCITGTLENSTMLRQFIADFNRIGQIAIMRHRKPTKPTRYKSWNFHNSCTGCGITIMTDRTPF